MLNNLIVFDFETTGLSPFEDHVTEIAAVRYVGGHEVGSFSAILNHGAPLTAFITQLTGLTAEICAKGYAPALAFALLRNFMGDATLVAHNAAFDTAFLNQMYGRLGSSKGELTNPFLCTKTLAVAVTGGRVPSHGIDPIKNKPLGPYTLANLCLHFEIPLEGAHRAMNDVRATWQLLDTLRALYNEEETLGLVNCCGMGPNHHPQRGLPAHAKPIVQ